MNTQEDRIIELLQSKRREDPKGFRKYLPDVADLLPELSASKGVGKLPFGLTGRERAYHQIGLREALNLRDTKSFTSGQAIMGLQHCAALIRDGSLAYGWHEGLSCEISHEILKSIVAKAIGQSPGAYRAKTTVPVADTAGSVLEQIPIVRGVYLDLDQNRRLVSISINPSKYKERRKVMALVGAGSDPNSDVAMRHDEYLAMQDPHGIC